MGRRAAAAREKAGAISGPRATFGVVKKKSVEPERPAWLDDIDAGGSVPVRSKSPPIAGRRAAAEPVLSKPDSPSKNSATGQKLTALKRRQDLNRRSLSRTSSAGQIELSDTEDELEPSAQHNAKRVRDIALAIEHLPFRDIHSRAYRCQMRRLPVV